MTIFQAGLPIVVGNWKQNTSRHEAIGLARRISSQPVRSVVQAICPPTIWLEAVRTTLGPSPIVLGAQTSSSRTDGALTGEVSAAMVAELCAFVIVGHSERRILLGESDDIVAAKLRLAHEAGLGVVLCVGETAEHRDRGDAVAVVKRHLRLALDDHRGSSLDLVVAYEPVWAIGAGRSATVADAATMAGAIRSVLEELLPDLATPILYGGSVNAANAATLIEADAVDGFLVGGASLRAEEFVAICHAARGGD